MGTRFPHKGRAPLCMGALRPNAKRAPCCMGSISQKGKMSTILQVQIDLPKRDPKNAQNHVLQHVFEVVFEHHWRTRVAHTQKCSSSSGRQRAPITSAQNIIVPSMFEDDVLLHPLLTHPSFAIRFQDIQNILGAIYISIDYHNIHIHTYRTLSPSPCWTIE